VVMVKTRLSIMALLDVSYFESILKVMQGISEKVALVHRDILTQRYSLVCYSGYRKMGERSLLAPVFPNVRGISAAARFGWYYLVCPLLDLLLALLAINCTKTRFAVFIASSCLDALVGLLLRRTRLVGKVIYWAMDWLSLSRFRTDIGLEKLGTFVLFQHMDRFCAEHCDGTWDATGRIGRAREALARVLRNPIRYMQHEVVYPPVVDFQSKIFEETRKPVVLLVGRGLREGEGTDLAIEGISSLLSRGFEVKFMIVSGSGTNLPDREKILDYARRCGVEKQVTIRGYVPTSELRQIIQNSTCGLSVFRDPNHVSNFAFPGKVVLYLESGLPVIVSKTSALATDIEGSNAGVAIEYQKNEFVQAFLEILSCEPKFRLGVAKFVQTRLSGERVTKCLLSMVALI